MSKHSKHIVDPKDKVPFKERASYGAGSGSFQLANDGVKQLAYPIFNMTLGLSPALVGLVLMISRLVDAFTDPIMGKISDDTRSRFGRRRPYIFFGAFLVAAAFIGIWLVPSGWSHTAIFVWYLMAMLIFYLCATIQTIPYHTLGLEMTPDVHERTVVSSYKMFFSFVFTFSSPWIFWGAQQEIFGNTMNGMRSISWGVALMIIAGGVLPAVFVKERYYHIAKNAKKVPFWRGVKLTFQNKAFVILTAVILTTGLGSQMVGALGGYVIFYYIFQGDTVAGARMNAIAANAFTFFAILSTFLVPWFSSRFGKVFCLKCLVVLGFVGAVSKFFLYSREYPYLLIAAQVMVAPLAAGFWIITASMKADICDDDELKNGSRREGTFGAIGGWISKVTMSSTFFIAGLIVVYSGFDIELGPVQPPEALFKMRVLFCAVPAIANVFAMFMLWRYPLDEKRVTEIRRELEERRSTVN